MRGVLFAKSRMQGAGNWVWYVEMTYSERIKEAIGKETDFSYAELVEERPEHGVQLKENIAHSRIQEQA